MYSIIENFKNIEGTSVAIALILLLALFPACTNDDDGTQGELPPATTAGLNTFGCFIDGELFLPREAGPNPGEPANKISAQYNYDPTDPEGTEYELIIWADNELTGKSVRIVSLRTDEPLVEGRTYPLTEEGVNNCWATYNFTTRDISGNNEVATYFYQTSSNYNGTLTISRLDEAQRILSGTFEFRAFDRNFDLVTRVTEGRFDLIYDQD